MRTVLLGDLVDISSSKRIFYNEYVDSGIPFYRSKEIIEKASGKNEISTELFISEERFNEINVKYGAPQEGDLLLTSVGTLGIPYLVQKGEKFYFKDGNLTWFRNFKPVLNRSYLLYWLTSQDGKNELQNHTIGSTQKALTIQGLKKVRIPLPEVGTQIRIKDILGSIDEKIELNRRMNDTLEQVGQALFKHYFIDNPEAKSWPKKKLSDFADVVTGKGSTKSLLTEGGQYPLYGANGIMGTSDSYLFDENLIMTGRVGTLGTVRISGGKLWASDNVLVIKPRKYFGYVYTNVKTFDFQSLNRGSTQPLVTQTDLKNQILLEPPVKLLDNFELSFMNSLKEIQNNDKQNLSLVSLRDSLLPRLISGKIVLNEKNSF